MYDSYKAAHEMAKSNIGRSIKYFDHGEKNQWTEDFKLNIKLNLNCMHALINKYFIRILMNKNKQHKIVVLQYRKMANEFGIEVVHKKIYKQGEYLA